MKKKSCLLAVLMICVSMVALAQKTIEAPKGKAIIQVFGNFHSGFGHVSDDRGFELDRSYLGYQYDLGDGLEIKGVMDIGQSDDVNDFHRIAYIKNAQITWKTGKWTLTGGLISNTQFNVQEKFWGYRYVMKSFQDLYKFGNSADLGISVAYKFADWISADAIVVNGEGYKKIQKNDGLMYGLGTTLTPTDGITMRLYYGLNEGADESKKDIQNLATFIGFKFNWFSLGTEYNWMWNAKNVEEDDYEGWSVYGNAKLNKKVDAYIRYDHCSDEKSGFIAGIQCKLGKYVKIAPNFRVNYQPMDRGHSTTTMGYISCYFGL